MVRRLGVVVLVVACTGGDEEVLGAVAAKFTPDPALALQHAPADDPENGATRWLLVEGATWEIRTGDGWRDGALEETLAVSLSGDLVVGDEVVLPASVVEGSAGGDCTVTSVAPFAGWYGTFDPAATVEITAGRAAGTWAFAEGLGPVRYTLDGVAWDLVWYEVRDP